MIYERTKSLVLHIDDALRLIAKGLNRGQPPYSGKIALVFLDEGGEYPAPTFKKLLFTRNGKCLTVRLPMKRLALRAAKKSSFAINFENVQELLRQAEALMEIRKEVMKRIKDAEHWERMFCGANEKKVESLSESIREGCEDIEDTLMGLKTRAFKEEERLRLGSSVEVLDGMGRYVTKASEWKNAAKPEGGGA